MLEKLDDARVCKECCRCEHMIYMILQNEKNLRTATQDNVLRYVTSKGSCKTKKKEENKFKFNRIDPKRITATFGGNCNKARHKYRLYPLVDTSLTKLSEKLPHSQVRFC
jgi:hypothetical protein